MLIRLQRALNSLLSVYYDPTRGSNKERPGFVSLEKDTFKWSSRHVRACAKCFFELKRRGVISGTETPRTRHIEEPSEDEQYEIEDLFDQIEGLSESIWKSERKWVDLIYVHFQKYRTITAKQRSILEDILGKLEDR